MTHFWQWPDGSVHHAPPPADEELARFSVLVAHRTLFKEGLIKPRVHDPLPPQDAPSFIEYTQEMSIEEAKKRWPNTPVNKDDK